MRIILITGKGGVGKTSITAATAVKAAEDGKKVLAVSTDLAHSLGDSLGMPVSGEETRISENLFALEVDPDLEGKKAWKKLHDYLLLIMTLRQDKGIETEEALLFPGLEDLFSLLRILEVFEQREYDLLIADCAPAGETLSLLQFPERLNYLTDRLLPDIRKMTSLLGPVISQKTGIPKPEDTVFVEFEELVSKLHRLQKLLKNPKITKIRLVMTPESIVLEEARRTYIRLQMLKYHVDAVYINKIYPQEALKGYFSAWEELQKSSLQYAKEVFSEQTIYKMALQDRELYGIPALLEAAEEMYGPGGLQGI